MKDIAEQLAIRDSYRRKLYARMTPQERLDRFYILQADAAAVLMKNPVGFQTFWRRNAQLRAVENLELPPSNQ